MKSVTNIQPHNTDEHIKIRWYSVAGSVVWTLLLTGLFVAYVVDNRKAIHEIGYSMANASLEKDILFRRWAARHGGVYVPETAATPPNPYLKHIPERDITTPSGKRLTLVNPAYMTRQIYEMAQQQAHLPRVRLTSLNPLRPENAPDIWETKALNALKLGAREIVESVTIQGQPQLRIMQPFLAEKSCFKCHSNDGYKIGEASGGISVTLSLAPIEAAMDNEIKKEALIHSMIWLLGLGFIWFGSSKMSTIMTSLRNETNRLCESEERYRALFTRAGDGIMILAVDGSIVEVNESIAQMHGYSVPEMQQMNLKGLDTPESQRFMRERMLRLLVGESLTFEVEHYHKDGHIIALEVSASLIFSGGDSYLQCFHRDITDRKRAESRLSESECRLRTIFENEPECIKILDQQGLLTQMNPAGLAMIEADSIEQVAGLPVLDVIAPEYREAYSDLHHRVIAGETMQMKYEVLGLKGGRRWLETHAVPMQDHGSVVHLAVTRDISESKQAEESLRSSQQKLTTLIETMPDIVFLKDGEGRWQIVNRAGLELFGLTGLPWQGKTVEELVQLQPASRELFHCCVESEGLAWQSGRPLHTEERVQLQDGQWRNFEVVKVPLFADNGRREGIVVVGRDITGRKRAEEERQQLEQQLQQSQKLESLGVLAGGIAHDFNNILTVILGHCYLAKEDSGLKQTYGTYFQPIESAANRAADLCRQMLTYAGKSPLVQARVNLWLLVDDVVKMLQSAIKKNIAIELDLNQRIPEIIGDTGQIQQIVMNLIINAAEAIGDAKGTIKVILRKIEFEAGQLKTDTFGTPVRAGKYSCLEVSDTGIGMSSETQKRIFEPFYTTKFAGRGLGMSAIRGIVTSHEGILELTSLEGVGTTFKVYFPVPCTSDQPDIISTTPALTHKGAGTILLVEDEQTLRSMGAALLEVLGFTTLTAEHGREALDIFRERGTEIDIILLDLIMPVMGGNEAYYELRKIAPTIPIVICSGYGIESVADLIENDIHAGFVHKPYKPEQLRDVILKLKEKASE
jgi:PAS domain S-box-containing protein